MEMTFGDGTEYRPVSGPVREGRIRGWCENHLVRVVKKEEERRKRKKIEDNKSMKIVLDSAGMTGMLGSFQDNGILGLTSLMNLTEEDLKELGLKVGQRRMLQVAIRDRMDRKERKISGKKGLFGGFGKEVRG